MRAPVLCAVVGALLLASGAPDVSSPVHAGTALRLDVEGLCDHAEEIVEGRVVSSRVVQTPKGWIETEYMITVERRFLGSPAPSLVFRFPGGVLADGSGMIVPGMPSLHLGEDVLLFLSGRGPSGVRLPVGLSQGKFRIIERTRGGGRVLLRSHSDLQLIDPATGKEVRASGSEVMSYEPLVDRVRAAVAARRTRRVPDEGR